MPSLFALVGYDKKLTIKEKYTYIINTISILLVLVFFLFFLFYIKILIINVVTILCLLVFFSVYLFLKLKMFLLAKFLMLFAFLFQETALVFLWFPPETHLNLFYFILVPIPFFIFDFDTIFDRAAIISINLIGTLLLFISVMYPNTLSLVELGPGLARVFSLLSVLSTMGASFVVYYFYALSLQNTTQELKYLANTDTLTNIYNRRTLYTEGEELFKLCKKYDMVFTFLIFDVDFFKRVNDEHGHPMGDEVLIKITELISKKIRQNDIFARYGGEEFAVILKDTKLENNVRIAHHLKDAVQNHEFLLSSGVKIRITISVGVVSYSSKYPEFDDMVKQADQALYEAKRDGRNRVIIKH